MGNQLLLPTVVSRQCEFDGFSEADGTPVETREVSDADNFDPTHLLVPRAPRRREES